MNRLAELHAAHSVDGCPADTADAILAALRLNHMQREALHTLVLDYCTNADRHRVRDVEAAAIRRGVPVDSCERARLLVESFWLPSGVRVSWGDATVEQHQQRIDWLSNQIAGISATIARHQQAIDAIVEAGASCLNDIEELAA